MFASFSGHFAWPLGFLIPNEWNRRSKLLRTFPEILMVGGAYRPMETWNDTMSPRGAARAEMGLRK